MISPSRKKKKKLSRWIVFFPSLRCRWAVTLFTRLRWAGSPKVTRPIQICRKQLPPAWVGMGEKRLPQGACIHSIILWNKFIQRLTATYIVGASPVQFQRLIRGSWRCIMASLRVASRNNSLHFSSQSVSSTTAVNQSITCP